LRAWLGSLLSAVGRLFKAPEHAHHHTMRR
jgi:hypothetical protein